MKLLLNDVWHLYGRYSITDYQQNQLGYVKLSNGYKGRLLTRLFNNDGTLIAEMQAPTLVALFYRLQVRDETGRELGIIEQRMRVDKITKSSAENKQKGSNFFANFFKWYMGIFGELRYKERTFILESSWPFFESIEVKEDDRVIMKFKRVINAPLLDFFLLRKYIPKLPYLVEVMDSNLSTEESITIALTVRQWVRHRRHHHVE